MRPTKKTLEKFVSVRESCKKRNPSPILGFEMFIEG